MKGIKITLIILSVIFTSALKAQNIDKNSVDSLKKKTIQLLENGTSAASDYIVYIKVSVNGIKRNISSKLTGKVLITDFGIICATEDGNLTLLFLESLKVELTGCPSKSQVKQYTKQGATAISVAKCVNDNIEIDFEAKFSNVLNSFVRVQDIGKDFCDKFNSLVKEFNRTYEEFEHNYQNIKLVGGTNNSVTEEQRKLIVQANYFNDNKNYNKALEFYYQAMKIDQFSYPEAYYNMALIAAELKNYDYAILNMKKYLLLRPNAEDARKARDKIYEWELNIK